MGQPEFPWITKIKSKPGSHKKDLLEQLVASKTLQVEKLFFLMLTFPTWRVADEINHTPLVKGTKSRQVHLVFSI